MKLSEIVANLDQTDEDSAIFADRPAPVGPDTPAQVAAVEGEVVDGPQYLLDVYLAKDALHVWSQSRDGRKPSWPRHARQSSGTPSTMHTCRSSRMLEPEHSAAAPEEVENADPGSSRNFKLCPVPPTT
jgi:hypothetical protein